MYPMNNILTIKNLTPTFQWQHPLKFGMIFIINYKLARIYYSFHSKDKVLSWSCQKWENNNAYSTLNKY